MKALLPYYHGDKTFSETDESTFYTLTLVFIFPRCFIFICYGTEEENLIDNWELLKVATIFFILATFIFGAKVILWEKLELNPDGLYS